MQPDGRIVAGGSSRTDFALARYNPDGALDTTFSGDGTQTTATGGRGHALALRNDGKILMAGTNGAALVGGDFALARYNPNGSLDTTFSEDGVQVTDLAGDSDRANGVEVQADGKIVAAGSAGSDFGFARYNPDGAADTSFSSDGKQTTDFAGGATALSRSRSTEGSSWRGPPRTRL